MIQNHIKTKINVFQYMNRDEAYRYYNDKYTKESLIPSTHFMCKGHCSSSGSSRFNHAGARAGPEVEDTAPGLRWKMLGLRWKRK